MPSKTATANKKATTITATKQQAALLDAAKSEPVTITINGKPAAVVLNARLYRQLEKLLHKIAEHEEDRTAIEAWEKAKKEGFLSAKESAAFTRKMRDALGN